MLHMGRKAYNKAKEIEFHQEVSSWQLHVAFS